ncbi:MAG: DUF5668 domain-containing protein [Patescibacteria group bacterium]|nr:DUF5668 domain-containing protein [Patescibacteria group bacterium]MDD5716045.1 DUF5668 domain-containing protein [Patescibacteria group bacterium]
MSTRSIIGIIVIIIGIQLLLTATGVEGIPSFGDWWPVIFVIMGILSWRSNPRMFIWPMVLIIVGVVFLLENYEVLPGSSWDYIWPGIVILIGLSFLVGKSWKSRQDPGGSGQNVSAVFGGRNEKVIGEFSRGSTTATFGGTQMDLRGANIADNAEIDAYASFGGIEIIVPRDVHVRLKITPIFGGSENKTNPDAGAKKTLTVSGTALFGGIEVKN